MYYEQVKIGVIISTSMSRFNELFNLSLHSVLQQSLKPDCIVVVDDNNDFSVSNKIKAQISIIGNPSVHYVRNTRTCNMSGTGAWNTGVKFIAEKLGDDCYFAILDDDDSWDEEYLENISHTINNYPDAIAVFAFLKRSDCATESIFYPSDLTVKNFLIGNPGIQGSNMCFKMESFREIDGFDEKFASCTDRDLMIRFLQFHGNEKIAIIPHKLVNHFVSEKTVTADKVKKKNGLDYFYKKYIKQFDFPSLDKSLSRAEKLFHYQGRSKVINLYYNTHTIAIGIAIHNNGSTIRRCLESALGQINCKCKLLFILADDNSSDNWHEEVADLIDNERIVLLNFNNNNVVKTRNMINDYIKTEIDNVLLVGRLDADDEYASETVLSEIENVYYTYDSDLILAGNYLRHNGIIIMRKNLAVKDLANVDYLLERLKKMSQNELESELPSCNLFVRPGCLLPYPDVASGEDHAFLVQYLVNQDKYKVFFAEDILLTIYNLCGDTTSNNLKTTKHQICRIQLYQNTLELCKKKKESIKH